MTRLTTQRPDRKATRERAHSSYPCFSQKGQLREVRLEAEQGPECLIAEKGSPNVSLSGSEGGRNMAGKTRPGSENGTFAGAAIRNQYFKL